MPVSRHLERSTDRPEPATDRQRLGDHGGLGRKSLRRLQHALEGKTMQSITIGIIGGGFVGNAVARGFMEHADVSIYDIDERRKTADFMTAAGADFVFVCLPTPPATSQAQHGMGGFHTFAIDEFIERYVHACVKSDDFCSGHGTRTIVIKSTIPVGYTRRLAGRLREYKLAPNILHNPEFLTARCAVVDYQTPARHLIGTPGGADTHRLMGLLLQRFPGIDVKIMTSDETEIAKLAENSFFATKVHFFNLVEMACKNAGASFEAVREAMLSDGRIAHAHTKVPGPDGKLGFGGACLPKDLRAFSETMPHNGPKNWLRQILSDNNQRRDETDRR